MQSPSLHFSPSTLFSSLLQCCLVDGSTRSAYCPYIDLEKHRLHNIIPPVFHVYSIFVRKVTNFPFFFSSLSFPSLLF